MLVAKQARGGEGTNGVHGDTVTGGARARKQTVKDALGVSRTGSIQ